MATTRFDFIRHHPECPKCGYDLVATVEAGRTICPECGYEFDIGELRHAVLPGEWTVWRGLGRASLSLLVRAAPGLAVWIGILWGVFELAALLSGGRHWFVVLVTYLGALLILVMTSLGIGRVLAKGMDERAGVVSLAVAALVTVFAWAVILAGALIVSLVLPAAGRGFWGVAAISCGAALLAIVKTHFFEDY